MHNASCVTLFDGQCLEKLDSSFQYFWMELWSFQGEINELPIHNGFLWQVCCGKNSQMEKTTRFTAVVSKKNV